MYYLHAIQGKLVKQRGDTKFLKEYVEQTISESTTRFNSLMDDLEPLLIPMREYKESITSLMSKVEKVPWDDVEEKFSEFQWILEQFSDIDWPEAATMLRSLMDRLPSLVKGRGEDRPELSLDGLANQIEIRGT